jgi:DNA-binding IclR family transcriptional regulator
MPAPLNTETALDVLLALALYQGRSRRSPSIQELAGDMGVPRTTLHHRLAVLKGRGLVAWESGQPRTLVITPDGDRLLTENGRVEVSHW